ncbi:hypothetical protein L4O91_005290 [Pseudomonas aeruginosa]|nr:hypothetical protein [Pseudomonas aeruginosa]EKU7565790.1 hypothetical protein [Pseudomonas aeruginosa]EKU7572212.1 hypothetical protein [Pseudomonas aeruginosa]
MGVIAWIAVAMHVDYILFPGLGALAHDVIKRPHGTWAKAPGMLVLTPLLTGLGILILRLFDLHVPPRRSPWACCRSLFQWSTADSLSLWALAPCL